MALLLYYMKKYNNIIELFRDNSSASVASPFQQAGGCLNNKHREEKQPPQ
jgi:hypothetical protein